MYCRLLEENNVHPQQHLRSQGGTASGFPLLSDVPVEKKVRNRLMHTFFGDVCLMTTDDVDGSNLKDEYTGYFLKYHTLIWTALRKRFKTDKVALVKQIELAREAFNKLDAHIETICKQNDGSIVDTMIVYNAVHAISSARALSLKWSAKEFQVEGGIHERILFAIQSSIDAEESRNSEESIKLRGILPKNMRESLAMRMRPADVLHLRAEVAELLGQKPVDGMGDQIDLENP